MDFTEQNLVAALSQKKIGDPLHFYKVTDSTNDQAHRLAEEGAPEGTVVIADSQTCGKGRMDRKWLSPAGLNIYSSIILKPDLDPAFSAPLTIMAGVAAAELLSSYCPRSVQIKWPNDLLINDKKVGGILTEMKTSGDKIKFVILGIGLNINMSRNDFPLLLRNIATSLRDEAGGDYFSRLEVAVRLYDKIWEYYQLYLNGGMAVIRDQWLGYMKIVGKKILVTFGEEKCQGTVTGVDATGALTIMADHGGERRVFAGDAIILNG